MKHLLIISLTAVATTLLALARWLDGGAGPGPRRSARPKSIDLPRTHYRFAHVPPSRWEIIKAGLVILFSSARFAAGVGV